MSPAAKAALEVAIGKVGSVLPVDEDVRAAWRLVWRTALRGRRITSRTLPRIAGLAQHAVAARDAIDALIREVPPEHYGRAADVRAHLVAILTAIEEETARREAYENGRP